MGKDYPEAFAAAPFAKRGGWTGTSERLNKWFETLADCVNKRLATPVLVSQVLLFFNAPPQSEHQTLAEDVEEHQASSEYQPSPKSEQSLPAVGCDVVPEAPLDHGAESSVSADRGSALASESTNAGNVEDLAEIALSDSDGAEKRDTKCTSGYAANTASPDIMDDSIPETADDTASYLWVYGYVAKSSTSWCDVAGSSMGRPVMRLELAGHKEQDGHTYYQVKCQLTAKQPVLRLDWTSQMRLNQMREELHDVVKDGLGKNYGDLFSQAPFARRGGLSGTTGRLQTWLDTLASCINEYTVQPGLLVSVLKSLDVPAPPQPHLAHKKETSADIEQKAPVTDSEDVLPPETKKESPFPPAPQEKPQQSPVLRRGRSFERARSFSPFGRRDSKTSLEDMPASGTVQPGEVSDEESTNVAFDDKRRQRGYWKLRDWFARLKRSTQKKKTERSSVR
jgi:hypothetical protein